MITGNVSPGWKATFRAVASGTGFARAREPLSDGGDAEARGLEAPGLRREGRRPRWTPTETDKALLETIFVADSFPTFSVRKRLAEQLNVDSRQVQIWFQNRRQRERVRQARRRARRRRPSPATRRLLASARDQERARSPRRSPPSSPRPVRARNSFPAAARRHPAADSRGTAPDPLCHSVCARSSADAHPALPPSARRRERPGGRRRVVVGVDLLRGRAGRPLLADRGPVEAPATLSLDLTAAAAVAAPSAVLRIEQLTDGRRVVHMAAGRVVEVPAEAPGALVQMLESASGARAVQAAALVAPLAAAAHAPSGAVPDPMQLASMEPPAAAGAGAPLGAASAAAARGGMAAAVGGGVSPRARASAASREAVDALFALGSNRA